MTDTSTPSSPEANAEQRGALSRAASRTWQMPTLNGFIARTSQLGASIATTAGVAELAGLSPRDTIVAAAVAGLTGSKIRGEATEFMDHLHEDRGKPKLSETPAPKIRKEKDPNATPKDPVLTRAREAARGLFNLNSENGDKGEKGPGLITRVGQAAYHHAPGVTGTAAGLVSGGTAGLVIGQNVSSTVASIAVGAVGGKIAQKVTRSKLEEADMERAKEAASGVSANLGSALRDTSTTATPPDSGDKDKGRGARR